MHRIIRSITIALVLCLFVVTLTPGGAQAQGTPDQELSQQAHPFAQGERALQRMGHRLPAVAKAHGLGTNELLTMMSQDPTLHVDNAGQLLYFEHQAPDGPDLVANAESSGNEFSLASDPGAAKTIFLDFDGHVTQGTTWNSQQGIDTIVSPAYDTDGDPTTFSQSELAVIAGSWAVVAEDFAPWNVNVTTIDPGPEALRRSGPGDTQWGIRVLITTDNVVNCECGGVAYIGAFDDVTDEPAFVFNRSFISVSQAISHEVGHSMLLAHDGSAAGSYYRGHLSGAAPGWAPIMGSPYWQPLSQWSQQEFTGANNIGAAANFSNGHDDIAIISSMTNGNNMGLRQDDHGDTPASATPIDFATETSGLITSRQDRDTFAFTTDGGEIDVSANPALVGPNLDIALTVRDSDGAIVGQASPAETQNASLSLTVDAGTYSVEIDGVGVGNPAGAAPTGYTDYASIGTYTVSITALAEPVIFGDVNCDGRSSVADALFVAQDAVGNRVESTECPLADPMTQIHLAGADVNATGTVSVGDALMISQCVVGSPNIACPDQP